MPLSAYTPSDKKNQKVSSLTITSEKCQYLNIKTKIRDWKCLWKEEWNNNSEQEESLLGLTKLMKKVD